MRGSRVLLPLLSVGALAGCMYDTGSDLPKVVEGTMPRDSELVTGCGGSSGLIESPSHSCTFLAPGGGGAVTAAMARSLRDQGFDVACARPGQITAVNEDVRVLAEVTERGFVTVGGGVANVFDEGYQPRGSRPIPAGSVAVRLGASRLVEASASSWQARATEPGRCDAPLPRANPIEHCVNWWNGVGWRTGEEARRLRARPAVQISATYGVELATCTYTLTTPRGTARVTSRFESGDWVWAPIRPATSKGPLQPNARLGPDARLSLLG